MSTAISVGRIFLFPESVIGEILAKAKWLDITLTLAYRMPYDKEVGKNDNVIGIRRAKTAV